MWRTIDGIVRCRSEHASRSSVQNSAKDTYSLFRKPGMAVLPPIRPMCAQNMPCRSPGKSAMLAATVALSPACSRPVQVVRHWYSGTVKIRVSKGQYTASDWKR